MNVLYVTLNSSLRSTTCVIDAVVNQMRPKGLNPVFVFHDNGPWSRHLEGEGIKCYYKKFIVPSKANPLQFIANTIFWLKVFKQHKIDILHMNEHDFYPMVKHAARIAGVKIVVGVRFVLNGGYANWAFGSPYTPDKLLFTSNDQLSRSLEELPHDMKDGVVEVFGNGRDLDSLVKAPLTKEKCLWGPEDSKTIVLGTASSIRPRKRLEDFILIVESLIHEGYNVHGIIAGGGKYADPEYVTMLEGLIKMKSLSNTVEMIGNLDDMTLFFRSIDMFVSTSELETFGMSVCEAMAFGMPVAAYEGGSVQEVISDNSYVAPNLDRTRLLELVKKIINNFEKEKAYAERHKQRVFDNFNAPALANKLNIIYEELL